MKDWRHEANLGNCSCVALPPASLQSSLQGIANKARQDKTYRFRNLFGLLTAGFLFWCWESLNRKASAGVDKIDAMAYEENLLGNIQALAEQVKQGTYRAKLILRRYIPKADGKQRPLGIPAIADKLLQRAVARLLEAIYEADFLPCSYGYRRGKSAHQAIQALTGELNSRAYHTVVEVDIKAFFNAIQHEALLDMLRQRIDDRPLLKLIKKWLKAGILETDGQVIHPTTGMPQGGIISPILANIYLHNMLDKWFEETVRSHCRGRIYLCRYADDFVGAFQDAKDAERFYRALIQRLARFGLEIAEDKTRKMVFSHVKAKSKTKFEFLGFEFFWGVSYWGKPVLKRRTSRAKLNASLAKVKLWLRNQSGLPKKILFAKLNRKLIGYYNYYGVTGNAESLNRFVYYVTQLLFRALNRRSQRKSYNWIGFKELITYFGLAKPRICHAL